MMRTRHLRPYGMNLRTFTPLQMLKPFSIFFKLRYKEGKSWDDHVNKFTDFLDRLATCDEELTDRAKASKLLRFLPESFSRFSMIALVQGLQVEGLIQTMHAEISRRKSLRSPTTQKLEQNSSTAARVSKSLKKTKKIEQLAQSKS